MLLEILQEHKAQIEALARRYGAGQIRVFGELRSAILKEAIPL